MSYSPYAIEVLVKVSEDSLIALMQPANSPAKRARVDTVDTSDRIAQPRGGRRTAATGARRPPSSPSPTLSNQQQLPGFGQTNGIQPSQAGGGFTFGQQQRTGASASFPQFSNSNSSNFTPPSSSFSFGSQLSTNPFTASTAFGNSDGNSNKSTDQAQTSSSSNLFLQSADVIKADAATAGLNPSVAAPHLGGLTFTKTSPSSEPAPVGSNEDEPPRKPQHVPLRPPEEPVHDSMASAVDEDGYPVKPAGPKPPKAAGPDHIPVSSPILPAKGQSIASQSTAPSSKLGTYGSAGQKRGASPPPRIEQGQPMVFTNSAPSSKPGTYGSAGRKAPTSPQPLQAQSFSFASNVASPNPRTFGSPDLAMPRPSKRTFSNYSEDFNADQMDTEATAATHSVSAPATQSNLSAFGNPPSATPSIFGSGNNPMVPQGLIPTFLRSSIPGNFPFPPHGLDDMDTDSTNPFQDFLDRAMGAVTLSPYQEVLNTDAMDTENAVAPGPAHNPFSFSTPSQTTPNMFSNAAKPVQSPFTFGQPKAATQPQQISPSTFAFGQTTTPAITQAQQKPPSAFAFGQPSATSQSHQHFDSDAMMISPEKNSTGPLGKSLFDRIERPPMDASSSPATTSTAPPPAFSFDQHASLTSDSQQSLPPSLGGPFGDRHPSSSSVASGAIGQEDPFGQANPPAASLFGQSMNGETSRPSDTTKASSPTKGERKMAEPKKHVEDKPTQGNPFSSLFLPKQQSSASSSLNAPSPFAPTPQAGTASATTAQSSGGLFGTLTNSNGQSPTSPFKPLNQTQETSNPFKPSGINQETSDQIGSNLSRAQKQSGDKGGTFDFLKPSTGHALPSTTSQKATSRDERIPLEPSTAAQNKGGLRATNSSKPANAVTNAADPDERLPKVRGRYGQPPSPLEDWTAKEKKQYSTAYRLKQLDVGAEAKRLALVSAKHTYKIKRLKKFFRKMERSIKVADGGPVRPVTKSPSPRARDSEQDDGDSMWPPISRGSRKLLHDEEGSDSSASVAAVSSGQLNVDDKHSRQQDGGPSGNSKRARVTEDQQVSYPSLSATAPNSNTSSMFKNILDKPTAMTNGKTSVEPSSSPFKSSVPAPSSLLNENKDTASKSAPNPFAASIAKWQAGAKGPGGVAGQPQDSARIEGSTSKPADTPSSPFTFKPANNNVDASSTSSAVSFKPSTVVQSEPNGFLAQFGKNSKTNEKEEMEKRKAADMDSDEDEAEWERRDAEEQRAKKQKTEQEASKLIPKFVPGQGFTFEASSNGNNEPSLTQQAPVSVTHVNELDRQHAEYAKQQTAAANAPNPFAKFMKQDSGNEGSKNGDADDEQEGSDEEEERAFAAKESTGGSLFDRISAPSSKANDDTDKDHPLSSSSVGVNIFGHVSGAAASVPSFNATNKTTSPAKTNPFGKLPSSTPSQNVFGTPTSSNLFKAPGSGEKGDNTWKPESPIKFGDDAHATRKKRAREEDDGEDGQGNAKKTDVKDAPAVNITSPSPSRAPLGSLFGNTKPNATNETPHKLVATPSAATPAGSVGSSFGFGISPIKPAPALGSLFPPSNNPSNGVSRSTSPGATTGESAAESNADGDDEATEKHEQLDLTSGGPGEEDEDILYEVRAKASAWDEKEGEKGEKTGGWETRGLGPFRIMKNPKTGKARMLMRSDPAGRIIINSSIFKQFKYDAPTKTTCRFPLLSPTQKLEQWVIKIGKESDAADIARILEENKGLD